MNWVSTALFWFRAFTTFFCSASSSVSANLSLIRASSRSRKFSEYPVRFAIGGWACNGLSTTSSRGAATRPTNDVVCLRRSLKLKASACPVNRMRDSALRSAASKLARSNAVSAKLCVLWVKSLWQVFRRLLIWSSIRWISDALRPSCKNCTRSSSNNCAAGPIIAKRRNAFDWALSSRYRFRHSSGVLASGSTYRSASIRSNSLATIAERNCWASARVIFCVFTHTIEFPKAQFKRAVSDLAVENLADRRLTWIKQPFLPWITGNRRRQT